MKSNPRMIAQIDIVLEFPQDYETKIKTILERAALNCPVHKSLSNEMKKNLEFVYTKNLS